MKRSLAIVIPAFNEAATIGDVVAGLKDSGSVIVVDDGSSDDTAAIASAAGADVVRHDGNRGYDQALNSGFARAAELGCDYVITLDADGQHPSEMIAAFMSTLEGGADLVLGVRDRLQRVSERVFAALTRLFFGIRDPLCGMKGYRMGLYARLGHFDSYHSIGTELMLFSVRQGASVAQLPLQTRERLDAPRFDRTVRANLRILRAAFVGLARYAAARTGRK